MSPPPSRIEDIIKNTFEFAIQRDLKTWDEVKSALSGERRSLHQIYGGNTTCVELKSDKAPMPIFFDAGTGLTTAGFDKNSSLSSVHFKLGRGKVSFFMTHTHWDHIIGLITLESIYRTGNEFHFYGVHKKLEDRIAVLFNEEQFPVPFRVVKQNFRFHQIKLHEPVKLGGLTFHHYPQTHPGGSFAYRVTDGLRTCVFATDTELRNIHPPQMIPGNNVYSNADVLVLDAQYSPEDFLNKEDYGHANIYMAVDFAVRENTKKLYLFHQSPNYTDEILDQQIQRAREYLIEKYGKAHALDIQIAIEGDEVEV